ncbi:unnamed protein product [Lota lota]
MGNKDLEDENETEEDRTMYLDVSPSLQQRYSCAPDYLHCLTAGPWGSSRAVLAFRWGPLKICHRLEVWRLGQQGALRPSLSLPMGDTSYKVQHLLSVPSQGVLVGACSDHYLRLFSNLGHQMSLVYQVACPALVLCMHYCLETGQVLTGSAGNISFWGFDASMEGVVRLLRVLDWRCCSLLRDTMVRALETDSKTSTLYALCDSSIKTFELLLGTEHRAFRGAPRGAPLCCISADWVQRYLFTGDKMGRVQVWAIAIRRLFHQFQAHKAAVSATQNRPSTQTLLTSSVDGWVKEWSRGGDLLLQLYLDDPGGVRGLILLDQRTVLCQSPQSFSVWRLQNLCRRFTHPGCGMKLLRRAEGGRGQVKQAWILALSKDRITRIISPTSGELLRVCWPFSLLEHALSVACDPGGGELLVACGTPEVFVLDMSLSPSPAKTILRTSEDFSREESVMCIEAVVLLGGAAEWGAAKIPSCLVFSGHRNGKLQLLWPLWLRCQPRSAHKGAILQMSSLQGPRIQLCCYGSDKCLSVWNIESSENTLEITLQLRIVCSSNLVLTRLLCGHVFGVCDQFTLFFYALPGGRCLSMARHPPTAITCVDYCAALDLVAISGPAGTVEVWQPKGVQLAEISLRLPVSQVCFANHRGDLLASFGGSIHIISCLRYLPARILKRVLQMKPLDDILEEPIPFLPHSHGFYDMSVVPKLFLKAGQTSPQHDEQTAMEAAVVWKPYVKNINFTKWTKTKDTPPSVTPGDQPDPCHAVMPIKDSGKERADTTVNPKVEVEDSMDSEPNSEHSHVPQTQLDASSKAQKRPLAPDGFLPNSVMRNWGEDHTKPSQKDRLRALGRTFYLTQDTELPPEVTLIKAKTRARRPFTMKTRARRPFTIKTKADHHLPDDDEMQREYQGDEVEDKKEQGEEDKKEQTKKDRKEQEQKEKEQDDPSFRLMNIIGQSSWLVKKPESFDLDMMVAAVLLTMEGANCDVYQKCTETLMHLAGIVNFPQELLQKTLHCFLQHAQKDFPHWKRVGGMNNLQVFLPKYQGAPGSHKPPALSRQSSLVEQPPLRKMEYFRPADVCQGDKGSIFKWRENLHRIVHLYGFRSPRAAELAAREHPGNFCTPSPRVSPMLTPPQPSQQVAASQRVVWEVRLKDELDMLPPWRFHHQVSLDYKLGSLTLDRCGTTHYGNLQVGWARGAMEVQRSKERKPKGPPIKSKDSQH